MNDPITTSIFRKPDPVMWSDALSISTLYQAEILLGLLFNHLHPGLCVKAVLGADDAPHVVLYRESTPHLPIVRLFHAMICDADNRLVSTWITQSHVHAEDLEFHHHLHEAVMAVMDRHLRRPAVASPGEATTTKIVNPSRVRAMLLDFAKQHPIAKTAKTHLQSDLGALPQRDYFRPRRQSAALVVMENLPDLHTLTMSVA